jgi:hypothetical protein
MESALKDLIVLAVLALGTPVSIVAASVSSRIRDAVFVLLIFGTTLTIGWLDVNFVSREWYRGTTRGFEVSFLDVLAVTLLCSTLWNRARNNARLFWPPSFGWLLVYFLYCCFNVAISDPRLFGLFELTKILRGIVAFLAVAYFVRGEREIKLLAFGVCAAVSFEGFVSLFDRYVLWRHRIAGTLIHPNALSTYCCVTVPLLIAMSLSNMGKYARLLLAFGAGLTWGSILLRV